MVEPELASFPVEIPKVGSMYLCRKLFIFKLLSKGLKQFHSLNLLKKSFFLGV